MAAESTYQETARVLKEWTAVDISHTMVGAIVRKVGAAQAKVDEELILELDELTDLPERKAINFLYAETNGVFVRGTEEKKSHEVSHAILYEGWEKNGKRVSLSQPMVKVKQGKLNDTPRESYLKGQKRSVREQRTQHVCLCTFVNQHARLLGLNQGQLRCMSRIHHPLED
ncbi:Uncharacterised protein family (UPF0236) [Amphibacillus marinus]|uniref:Uncharacterized protein family (UPF0236) n=1 Tax=Amphibacillus marinus TaxID=872970 RepID=A0A1H8MVC3_9BACI|nr:UPF0236 family protein [Amphibacillus marinus]SEO21229.1 Uncharacterised protein family (UPF0236) [Amphibacillus marinus]